MDFFSEKELITQTGHAVDEWPLVFLKEALDNALDACEESEIAPKITVTADAEAITVEDNGPGIPESTIEAALNFSVRASNREAYVAPDRGAQGNALKTLIPMARVIDEEHGKFTIVANGKQHVITCAADPISQRPVIYDDVADLTKCKKSKVATNVHDITDSAIEDAQSAKVPKTLRRQIAAVLKKHPDTSWDKALARIVQDGGRS